MVDEHDGQVEAGFEPVAEAFARNFAQRGEVGAAFAATLDGRPVVDLWGGVADGASGRPWQRGTLQLIFSGTKGLTALCVAMLADRGLLRLDDPICAHWPEFAAAGKEAITVAEVLSHRARLPGLRTPVGEQDILDPLRMADLLAGQAPEHDPRVRFAYHRLTYGWLCTELIRRVDGRTAGRFFAEEVAGPLGLELWIGLPPALEPRVAVLQYGPAWGKSSAHVADPFPGDALWISIWRNPPMYPADHLPWNEPGLHAAELPAANAIGTVRSIARLYGALARGGEVDGVRIVSPPALEAARAPLASGTDPFLGETMVYGAGFELSGSSTWFGPASAAFGHGGAGGSVHGAWPEQRVGFSYAMNELRDDPAGDERARALLEALHRCVAASLESSDR